ncbi:MAG: hypothetical protein P1U87_08590 [Verrucomicrobiales bacterium]|nr:hypothetical protein [Verrucomicrobiales bacterium]
MRTGLFAGLLALFSFASLAEGASIPEKLRSIIIPSIEFSEAPIADAIAFLQTRSAELDTIDRTGINVILDAKGEAAMKDVSLNLRNVTLGRALWFLAEVSGFDLRVDSHAVMLVARSGEAKKRGKPEIDSALAKKLRSIVIPSLEFQDTPFDDALQFLRDVSVRDDPDPNVATRGINIVKIPAPPGSEPGSVTMRLNNTPITEAIRYACALAGYDVTVEKGAVIVFPEEKKP